eukprot:SM000013S26571  [mRNA]  locus=s13:1130948:1132586:- [translate_table: standard]
MAGPFGSGTSPHAATPPTRRSSPAPPLRGDIVRFGEAAKRMQEQDWILEAHLEETLPGVCHQKCVAIVHWVAELVNDSWSTSVTGGQVDAGARLDVIM